MTSRFDWDDVECEDGDVVRVRLERIGPSQWMRVDVDAADEGTWIATTGNANDRRTARGATWPEAVDNLLRLLGVARRSTDVT